MKSLFFSLVLFVVSSAGAVDMAAVNAALQSPEGLELEVHGADQENFLYTVAYRNPQNFFDSVYFPIIADYTSPEMQNVKTMLTQLVRHDRIRVKGQFNTMIDSPQRHILAKNIVIISKYKYEKSEWDSYKHQTIFPEALKGKTEAIFKVHALILTENQHAPVMVVEYGDAILPVFTKNLDAVKNLYRNDKIKLKFTIMSNPGAPVHLRVGSNPDDITVISSIKDVHGQPLEKCGPLVMFPQSAIVNGNVFAIKQDIGDNLDMTFTLLNFDPAIFKQIRAKLQAIWDSKKELAVRERNYLTNYSLTICAKGTGNEVDPNQANPQILLDSADSLSLK
ncbi:MAG: hypothetical protein K2Q26_13320 [Bdellovibrionales bacterium]|nr:hypothetical protein [Bdellovibrionales bacterium]